MGARIGVCCRRISIYLFQMSANNQSNCCQWIRFPQLPTFDSDLGKKKIISLINPWGVVALSVWESYRQHLTVWKLHPPLDRLLFSWSRAIALNASSLSSTLGQSWTRRLNRCRTEGSSPNLELRSQVKKKTQITFFQIETENRSARQREFCDFPRS